MEKQQDNRARLRELQARMKQITGDIIPLQEKLTQRYSAALRQRPVGYSDGVSRVDEDMLAVSRRMDALSNEYLALEKELAALQKLGPETDKEGM